MPIQFACTCGKQLRTKDENAGKRLKCPGCGESVPVPKQQPAASAAKVPGAGMVRFHCDCGKVLQARAEHAGKRTRCPGCGEMVPIPAGNAIHTGKAPAAKASSITAQRKPAAAAALDGDEEELPHKKRAPRRRSVLPMLLGVVVALLLLAGGAGAGLYFFLPEYLQFLPEAIRPAMQASGPKPAKPGKLAARQTAVANNTDLELVRPDALYFFSIRMSDLWKSPAGAKIRQQLDEAVPGWSAHAPNADLGPETIERMTWVTMDPLALESYVILASEKPFDEAKLLQSNSKPLTKVEYKGKTYYSSGKEGDLGLSIAVYLVSDRVAATGLEGNIKKLIDQPPPADGKGPLAEALKVARGKHHFVLGVSLPDKLREQWRKEASPAEQPFLPFLEMQYAVLTADLDQDLDVDLRSSFPDEAKAKAAQQAAQNGIQLLSQQLKSVQAQPPPGVDAGHLAQVVGAADALLHTPVEQKGTLLRTHAKVAGDHLMAAVTVAPAFLAASKKPAGPGEAAPTPHKIDKPSPEPPVPAPPAEKPTKEPTPPATPGEVASLAFIKPDAEAFVSLRVADLWKSELGKKVEQQLNKAIPGWSQLAGLMVGLLPVDIERVSVVVVDAKTQSGYAVAATTKAYDKDRLLKLIPAPGARQKEAQGKTYYAVPPLKPDMPPTALYFISDHLLLAGTETVVQQLLAQPPQSGAKGPLSDALALATAGHHVVIGVVPRAEDLKQVRDSAPPSAQPFLPVLELKSALASADLGKDLDLDLTLTYPDETKAKAAQQAIQFGVMASNMVLQKAKSQPAPGPSAEQTAKLIQSAETLLKTPVEQQGPVVKTHVKVDSDTLAAAMALIAAQGAAAGSATTNANNLKQIVIAMHNYHDANGHFPPAVVTSPDGKPLYSWRVALLPYLDALDVAKEFHMDEPWDSTNNIKLISKMPKVFASAGVPAKEPGQSFYKVFAGPGAAFDGKQMPKLTDFKNGTSNAILVVEVGPPVPWTKPEDVPYDKDKPLPPLVGPTAGGLNAAMADGSVQVLKGFTDKSLRNMIEPGGAK